MMEAYDDVESETQRSLRRMDPRQLFSILLMHGEKVIKPKFSAPLPVRSNEANIAVASKFVRDIIPMGCSNPIPALRRAYATLNVDVAPNQSAVIYLMSDGKFDNPKAVLAEVKKLHAALPKGKKVFISTYLYEKTPEAWETMKEIAKITGGRYRWVMSLEDEAKEEQEKGKGK